ncbi:MAG: DUF3016 domain-containing protein [Opitutaceae bacterium]|nr:DUF3016 domain-containing protein [Opitutaceae bacterium]
MNTKAFTYAIVVGLLTTSWAWGADTQSQSAKQSRVSVTFIKPEAFTDAKDSMMGSDRELAGILDEIREHLGQIVDRYIPKEQHLDLKITNIDMAGDFEPWSGPQAQDVRIIKEIYPPRIDLEFRLTDSTGKMIKEGSRELRDMSFLMKPQLRLSSLERLPYEKELLVDWLRSEFGDPLKSK